MVETKHELGGVAPNKNMKYSLAHANYPTPMEHRVLARGDQSAAREALNKQLTTAADAMQSRAKKLGLAEIKPPERSAFIEKGYKVGGKTALQDELNQLIELQKESVREYVKAAGFTDQYDIFTAEQHMNERLNAVRKNLMRIANAFNLKLQKERIRRQEKGMLAQSLGSIAGTITGAIVGGYLGAGNPMAIYAGAQTGGSTMGKLSAGLARE